MLTPLGHDDTCDTMKICNNSIGIQVGIIQMDIDK